MDSGYLPLLAAQLAAAGFACVRFTCKPPHLPTRTAAFQVCHSGCADENRRCDFGVFSSSTEHECRLEARMAKSWKHRAGQSYRWCRGAAMLCCGAILGLGGGSHGR